MNTIENQIPNPNTNSNTTIFVNGLPQYLEKEQLHFYFKKFGKIQFIRIFTKKGKHGGIEGFAKIRFASRFSLIKATANFNHKIGEMKVRVRELKSQAELEYKISKSSRLLYVTNIDYGTKKEGFVKFIVPLLGAKRVVRMIKNKKGKKQKEKELEQFGKVEKIKSAVVELFETDTRPIEYFENMQVKHKRRLLSFKEYEDRETQEKNRLEARELEKMLEKQQNGEVSAKEEGEAEKEPEVEGEKVQEKEHNEAVKEPETEKKEEEIEEEEIMVSSIRMKREIKLKIMLPSPKPGHFRYQELGEDNVVFNYPSRPFKKKRKRKPTVVNSESAELLKKMKALQDQLDSLMKMQQGFGSAAVTETRVANIGHIQTLGNTEDMKAEGHSVKPTSKGYFVQKVKKDKKDKKIFESNGGKILRSLEIAPKPLFRR